MKQRLKLTALSAAALLTSALAACGGGGTSQSSANSGQGGSTSGAAAYSGAVTGLGSIVVNGVRFATSGATLADPDNPDQPYAKAFTLGTTVTVTGTVNADGTTGSATSVAVQGGVRGLVTAVNVAGNTFTVAGQTVTVDTNTVFDGQSASFGLSTLVANSTAVEVFGTYNSATNTIAATRVEQKTSADMAALGSAIKGQVSTLDTNAHTFSLTLRSGVTVQVAYSDANVKPAAQSLANGADVRVLLSSTDATSVTTANANSTVSVTATKVLIKANKQANGVNTKIQGIIKTVSADHNTWAIGDATVDVSQAPQTNGLTLANVTAGTAVKVEGSFTNGVLVAKEVEADQYERSQPTGGVKLFGAVTSNSPTTTPATFTVQGVSVATTATPPAVGTYVEVLARPDSQGVLTAITTTTPTSSPTAPKLKPFELFGLTSCTNGSGDLQNTFTLQVRDATLHIDGSGALVTPYKGLSLVAQNTAQSCFVEVRGQMYGTPGSAVLRATNIDVITRFATVANTAGLSPN